MGCVEWSLMLSMLLLSSARYKDLATSKSAINFGRFEQQQQQKKFKELQSSLWEEDVSDWRGLRTPTMFGSTWGSAWVQIY